MTLASDNRILNEHKTLKMTLASDNRILNEHKTLKMTLASDDRPAYLVMEANVLAMMARHIRSGFSRAVTMVCRLSLWQ